MVQTVAWLLWETTQTGDLFRFLPVILILAFVVLFIRIALNQVNPT